MKKRAAIAAAAAAALFAAAALAWFFLRPGSERGESPQDEAVELVYYTIGDPDEDLELVNEAVNELLLERYGFTVDYRKVGWNEYENQLTALINTHSGFDIAFAWAQNYQSNAAAGHWLDLTELLEDHAALYDAVDERFWRGAAVGGRIYGVPTNKELATPLHFLYSAELVEKYDIDIEKYGSIRGQAGYGT